MIDRTFPQRFEYLPSQKVVSNAVQLAGLARMRYVFAPVLEFHHYVVGLDA